MDTNPDDSQSTAPLLPSTKKNKRSKKPATTTTISDAAMSIFKMDRKPDGPAYTALRSSNKKGTYKPSTKKPKHHDKPSATTIFDATMPNCAINRPPDGPRYTPLRSPNNQSYYKPSTKKTKHYDNPSATKILKMPTFTTTNRPSNGPRYTALNQDDNDFRISIPNTALNQNNEDVRSNSPDTAMYIRINIPCVEKPVSVDAKWFYRMFGLLFVLMAILFVLVVVSESSPNTKARVITSYWTD
jgi:hypothetical protein